MPRPGRTHAARHRLELAVAALVGIVALPACPISDDYFIEPNGDDGSGNSGAASGTAAVGGSAAQGSTGGTSGGTGGATGGASGGTSCEEPCNAPRACTAGCQDGWISTSTPPGGFSPREKAAYTSIGNQLFIWGGVNESGTALNSGALYDPRTDVWTVVASDANTPSPRSLAAAVWTGSVIVVWGGFDPVSMEALADGAIYDPVSDAWSPMATGPRARAAPVGGSVSGRLIFFGGQDREARPVGGLADYDPVADTWLGMMPGNPPPVADPAVGAGALTLWLYGGRTPMNTGVSELSYYSMASTRWVDAAPRTPGRWGSFAAFAGAFFVWGGRNLTDFFGEGALYNIALSRWESTSSFGAPSARFAVDRESGWTFALDAAQPDAKIVLIAGLEAPGSYLGDGAIYDVDRDAWEAIEAWPSSASHAFGAAGVAAGELVVWGGRDGETLTNQGVRYRLPD